MTKAFFVVAMAVFALACSGTDDGGDGGDGGSAGSGGGANSSGTGGTSAAGMSNAKPMGPVETCFGTCPMGACDNDMFFAEVACSSVYTAPVNASSSYCTAQAAGYCLEIGKGGFDKDSFAITCVGGVAAIDFCEKGGCSASGTQAQCL